MRGAAGRPDRGRTVRRRGRCLHRRAQRNGGGHVAAHDRSAQPRPGGNLARTARQLGLSRSTL
ncbi:hypothetical protein FZ025_07910 [Xanthomonas hyacinthi]|nr:hypothetical protein FZ025_07910 [Xanthomonas hyacinthi]